MLEKVSERVAASLGHSGKRDVWRASREGLLTRWDQKQIRLLKYWRTADSERRGEKINYVD